jgi:hypothetical protein
VRSSDILLFGILPCSLSATITLSAISHLSESSLITLYISLHSLLLKYSDGSVSLSGVFETIASASKHQISASSEARDCASIIEDTSCLNAIIILY